MAFIAAPRLSSREVLRRSIVQTYPTGEAIYHFGDPLGGIYGVVTGAISVDASPGHATPVLMHIGTPGMWTGEGCFFTRQPRRIELRAVMDTCMMHLSLEAMDQMAARDPNTVRNFAQILMINVDTLLRIVHDLQQRDASRRIASVLWRISPGPNPTPLTQTEIGVMANASRKQVNAALPRHIIVRLPSRTWPCFANTPRAKIRHNGRTPNRQKQSPTRSAVIVTTLS